MKKVYAVAADGTEEGELLNVVDILRRAGVDTEIVSIGESVFTSSHGVKIAADRTLGEVDLNSCDLLFVPGGMPGSKKLAECEPLISAIRALLGGGKKVAAICAAPALVLGEHGLIDGKRATCFPDFESRMGGAIVTGGRVETDGNITTARGLGCALELGLELVKLLCGEAKSAEIRQKIQF